MARDGEMAPARSSRRPVRDDGRLLSEVVAVLSLTASVFTLLSFLSYGSGAGRNIGGRVGYGLADAAVQAFGLAAFLLPVFLAVLAVLAFRGLGKEVSLPRALGTVVLAVAAAVLLALVLRSHAIAGAGAGGWVGGFLAAVLRQGFGAIGAALLATALLLLAFLFVTRLSIGGLAAWFAEGITRFAGRAKRVMAVPVGFALVGRSRENVKKPEAEPESELEPTGASPVIVLADEVRAQSSRSSKRRRPPPVQEEFPFEGGERYQLPPLGFLDASSHGSRRIDADALRRSSQILETKLGDFGIRARVVEVRPGPVITTFDVEPAAGVKVNRIVSLGDDLAMALRVTGVRILAPVPGKAVVGIEVANPERETVLLRELMEDEAFARAPSPVTLALGRDTAGTAVYGDLARMPHLLVAGVTGSGKSVALNAMIVSILYKATPHRVRFVMVDLKMLELSIYEDIPHLLVPVVTDPKKAVVVLKNIVDQMDERYQLMNRRGVRNIDGYNKVVERERRVRDAGVIELDEVVGGDAAAEEAKVPLPLDSLPRIVVVIDELADLMMTMGRQVEEPITRLAQKARAAGIHLILATQRPSVDVITGLIKANFPARISFQTTTRVDSRTIIDQIGAERLLGAGDMLYMPPGTARVERLQSPLITEEEIRKITEYCRAQAAPEYAFALLENVEEEGDGVPEDDLSDELYDQAVRLVTESRQASISWVQRRLRVGYNRAARMIERMERDGVVSVSEGGRSREVLAQRIDE